MGEIINLTHHRTVVVVEPALARPVLAVSVPEVPLAHHNRSVARLFQSLRQQPLVGRQAILARRRDDQGLQAVAERVAPGHQRCPRRRAHRLNVELLKPGALLGKPIDVRRLDIGAVKADVLPP